MKDVQRMTGKSRIKILYLLLPMILLIGICGSQTSNELSGYFKPYGVENSNDIFSISIDKAAYKPGQTINILGKVNHYDEGTRATIQITGPDKVIVGNFDSLVDRFGIFESSFAVPDTVSFGKYTLSSYYDGDPHKKQLSFSVNISDNQNGIAYVLIPEGASAQEMKLNFDPPTVNVTQGSKIVFINNDGTVHTVVAGKVNADGTLSLDNSFRGGYVTPGDRLVISPPPGKYNYFCKIHPWLGGSIYVKPDPALAKHSHKPSIPAAKIKSSMVTVKGKSSATKTKLIAYSHPSPVSNSVLATIWKERHDLQKLYPEVAHGNITNLAKWAAMSGWNQDKRLAALIPAGKVPSYLDSVLVAIWGEQKNLQRLYPEVAHGNLGNLTNWATKTGWSQDPRLSVLIPPGKIVKF